MTPHIASIMQRYANGETIQYKPKAERNDIWVDVMSAAFNFDKYEYRPKPKVKRGYNSI